MKENRLTRLWSSGFKDKIENKPPLSEIFESKIKEKITLQELNEKNINNLEWVYTDLGIEEKNLIKFLSKEFLTVLNSQKSKLKKLDPNIILDKYTIGMVIEFLGNLLEDANAHTLNKLLYPKLIDLLGKESDDKGKLDISNLDYLFKPYQKLVNPTSKRLEWSFFDVGLLIINILNELDVASNINQYKKLIVDSFEKHNDELDNEPNPFEESKQGIDDLKLGDKLELSDGDIVYFLKKLSNKSIWVTDNEEDRFKPDASGYVLKVSFGTKMDVLSEEDNVLNDYADIMFKALEIWKEKGQAKNIRRVKKGGLLKEYPQFKTELEPFNRYDAFVFDGTDPFDSTVSKRVLVFNGSTIQSMSLQLVTMNTWNVNEFYKIFKDKGI